MPNSHLSQAGGFSEPPQSSPYDLAENLAGHGESAQTAPTSETMREMVAQLLYDLHTPQQATVLVRAALAILRRWDADADDFLRMKA